jgi:hypothetical protein
VLSRFIEVLVVEIWVVEIELAAASHAQRRLIEIVQRLRHDCRAMHSGLFLLIELLIELLRV